MTDHIPAPKWLADLYDDRDRARSIAVTLEQENADLTRSRDRWRRRYFTRAADRDRLHAEAHAAHGVIEQAGLLQEFFAKAALPIPPHALERILNGGTFDEVRQAIYDGANDG